MDIQHRDIPDSGRHEPKGASTAAANSVLTADGIGGSVFKKIDKNSIAGTFTTGPLSVTPAGVFSTDVNAYAMINKTSNASATFLGTNRGITLNGGSFTPTETGVYHVSASTGFRVNTTTVRVAGPEDFTWVSTSTPVYPTFRNVTAGTNIFTGQTGVLQLVAGILYTFSDPGAILFTVARVA